GSYAVDGAAPRPRTAVALVDLADFDFDAGLYLGQDLHAADGLGEDIARACEPCLVALGDRRAAEGGGDRRPLRPIGDFSGYDHGAGIGFGRHIDRHVEIDLLTPGQHRRRERKYRNDGLRRRGVEQFGVKLQRTEIEADAGHAASLLALVPARAFSRVWQA